MRVPLRRASKAREGRILFCIRPTSNAAGVDAAAPEWVVYFDRGPKYLVVGAHALAAHGVVRTTKNMDI